MEQEKPYKAEILKFTLFWNTLYLEGITQYVDIIGSRSERKKIKVGIFQGSVAGPLFFIIYFNETTVTF